MELSQNIIDDAVRLTVEAVHPLRIILFGSAARGELDGNSDLDLLVVMPDGVNRRETARKVRKALLPIKTPVDVVVTTEADLREYGDNPGLVFRQAIQEGRTIYAA